MAFEVVLVENKLRPLIFGNSFRNIQKTKNGLRPSSVKAMPCHLPPGGEGLEYGKILCRQGEALE